MNHQTLYLYQFFLREYITRGPFICVCLILFMSIYLTNYLAIDLSTVQDERERERGYFTLSMCMLKSLLNILILKIILVVI